MELKSYFCPRCGRGFNRREAIGTDERIQCVYCRDTQLCIAGWPYVLLAMFLGLAAYLARQAELQVHGELLIFLPAAFGLFLIGIIRMIQEHYRKRHPLSKAARDELAEQQAQEKQSPSDATADGASAASTEPAEAGETPEQPTHA
jgi:DNA-directed RNA polymerase subunit RPC12/RpoP